jgi:hypothetical protein
VRTRARGKVRILVFGTGAGGVNFYKNCRDRQNVIGFLDNNPQKQGDLLFRKKIYGPQQLITLSFDKIVIASDYYQEIQKQLIEELTISEDKITVHWPSQERCSRLQFLRKRAKQLQFKLICKQTGLASKKTIRELIETTVISKHPSSVAPTNAKHRLQISNPVSTVTVSLRTMRDWAKTNGLPLLEVAEVEEVPFKAPHVWGHPATTEVTIALSNKPYVADVTDVRIFSNSSIILTSDGTAISDTGGHPRFGRLVNFIYEPVVVAQQNNKVILSFSNFQTREIEAGIFLSGLVSYAFGHWLPEFLPKLQFLQLHPHFESLPIIVDAGMPKSHFDHLRRLCDNPLILLEANESLICRRLLVAPSPTFLPTELFPNDIPVSEMPGLSPRAMRFIRGSQSSHGKLRRNKRIFLARKNMKWRHLINESEIEKALADFGFDIVFIEDMAVQEQIDIFQQAEWIVAPNGSALLNLIFAHPHVKLLILTQPNLHNWGTFQGPMESLGYSPLWVAGDYAHAKDQKHSHYHVPLQRIFEALSFMGMNEIKN